MNIRLLPLSLLLGAAVGAPADPSSASSSSSAPPTTATWASPPHEHIETPLPQPLTLQINRDSGVRNKTAPLLHGLFFEDINHSGDGGLYAELIRNRAFQGSDVRTRGVPGFKGGMIIPEESENPIIPWGPTLTGWRAIGRARLSLDRLNPLSDALPVVLRVDIPDDLEEDEEVGFLNEGWWGMDIKP